MWKHIDSFVCHSPNRRFTCFVLKSFKVLQLVLFVVLSIRIMVIDSFQQIIVCFLQILRILVFLKHLSKFFQAFFLLILIVAFNFQSLNLLTSFEILYFFININYSVLLKLCKAPLFLCKFICTRKNFELLELIHQIYDIQQVIGSLLCILE